MAADDLSGRDYFLTPYNYFYNWSPYHSGWFIIPVWEFGLKTPNANNDLTLKDFKN